MPTLLPNICKNIIPKDLRTTPPPCIIILHYILVINTNDMNTTNFENKIGGIFYLGKNRFV